MFTGIIQGTASVVHVQKINGIIRLVLELPSQCIQRLKIGASIAVDGTCLTVVASEGRLISFDVVDQTLSKTTLGSLQSGHRVNIERAARFGDEIGGHLVSGHVSGTATISDIKRHQDNVKISITCEPEWMKYLFDKGFVAVDGISLTVAEVGDDAFSVHLIPETVRATTLGTKQMGSLVNIELDAHTVAVVSTVTRIQHEKN